MTAAQSEAKIIKALHRTRQSISAHVARGAQGLNSLRSQTLCDRYDDLKDALNGDRGHSPAWRGYCAEIGADPSHKGLDLF
ncbi:hypothetical protein PAPPERLAPAPP_00990 [Brevundimonas phage vB_BpoS-Papperlapapp]|nr:hypothetical protein PAPPERLAPAPP_00990 [Brevundimonas phage vB_BpoS-Papperlapapp]